MGITSKRVPARKDIRVLGGILQNRCQDDSDRRSIHNGHYHRYEDIQKEGIMINLHSQTELELYLEGLGQYSERDIDLAKWLLKLIVEEVT